MGDPKFSRRKYSGPPHPWQEIRMGEERDLIKKYGLKNKKEVWKAESTLRRYRRTARNLQARLRAEEAQAEKEREEFLEKLQRMALLSDEADLDDVLALEVEALLNRRLQTVVQLKGLAYTMKQARQLINHGHIIIGDRKVTIPSYHLKRNEDGLVDYRSSSPLAHELHPMRPKPEIERELEKAEMASDTSPPEKEEEKAKKEDEEKKEEKPSKPSKPDKPAKEEKAKKEEKPSKPAKPDKPAKKEDEAKKEEKPSKPAKPDKPAKEEKAKKEEGEDEEEKAPDDLKVEPGGED